MAYNLKTSFKGDQQKFTSQTHVQQYWGECKYMTDPGDTIYQGIGKAGSQTTLNKKFRDNHNMGEYI